VIVHALMHVFVGRVRVSGCTLATSTNRQFSGHTHNYVGYAVKMFELSLI